MEKVCVFGGSGFLGSHVADKLTEAGFDVTVFDIKSSQWASERQKFVLGNILDAHSVESAVVGCDYVFNFAGLADLNAALGKPQETVRLNIEGNVTVLNACIKANVKRYVYASSIYVHSNLGGFYRCSKQAAEAYVEEFQRSYGIDYTILRYGSLYGPRADGTNGIWRIIKAALETGELKYDGHPDSLREYIHVEDAAIASVAALTDGFRNESVVLTGQEPMKVQELLKMLAEILGLPDSSIRFKSADYSGHYVRTPYAYQPKLGRKYIPPLHVDMGQGLLQMIEEIHRELEFKPL